MSHIQSRVSTRPPSPRVDDDEWENKADANDKWDEKKAEGWFAPWKVLFPGLSDEDIECVLLRIA